MLHALVLFGFSFINSYALDLPEYAAEVIVGPKTGINFIYYLNKGELVILNDRDASFEQRMTIAEVASREQNIELSLSDDEKILTVLSNHNGTWTLGGLVESDGTWQLLSKSQGISGSGIASLWFEISNGTLAVQVDRGGSVEKQVIVVESPTDAGDSYRLAEIKREPRVERDIQVVLEDPEVKYSSGIGLGFGGGWTSGVGIAYRQHFANHWGLQVAAVPYDDDTSTFISGGANAFYTLHKSGILRFYVLGGGAVFHNATYGQDWEKCDYTDPNAVCDPDYEWTKETLVNAGVGIGLEFRFLGNLAIAIEAPISVSFKADRDGFGYDRVAYWPNGALVYYFPVKERTKKSK